MMGPAKVTIDGRTEVVERGMAVLLRLDFPVLASEAIGLMAADFPLSGPFGTVTLEIPDHMVFDALAANEVTVRFGLYAIVVRELTAADGGGLDCGEVATPNMRAVRGPSGMWEVMAVGPDVVDLDDPNSP